jgi:hypothetical protein
LPLGLEALAERTLPSVAFSPGVEAVPLKQDGSNHSGQAETRSVANGPDVADLAGGVRASSPGVKAEAETAAGPGHANQGADEHGGGADKPTGEQGDEPSGSEAAGKHGGSADKAAGEQGDKLGGANDAATGKHGTRADKATDEQGDERGGSDGGVPASRGADLPAAVTVQDHRGEAKHTEVSSDPGNPSFPELGEGGGSVPVLVGEQPVHVEAALIEVHLEASDRVFVTGFDGPGPEPPFGAPPNPEGDFSGLLPVEAAGGQRAQEPARLGEAFSNGAYERNGARMESAGALVWTGVLSGATSRGDPLTPTEAERTAVDPLHEPAGAELTPESVLGPNAVRLVPLEDNGLAVLPAFLGRAADEPAPGTPQRAGGERPPERFVVGLESAAPPGGGAEGKAAEPDVADAAPGNAGEGDGEADAADAVWAEVADWSLPLLEGAFVLGLWQGRWRAREAASGPARQGGSACSLARKPLQPRSAGR